MQIKSYSVNSGDGSKIHRNNIQIHFIFFITLDIHLTRHETFEHDVNCTINMDKEEEGEQKRHFMTLK